MTDTSTEFPPELIDRARALAEAPESASAGEVEALPEPLALRVLEASVRHRSLTLATALVGSRHKALAKAAKKALYQLKSSGVAVPEKRTSAGPAAPATANAAEEVPPSLVSTITGTGERALIIGRPVRGRIETLQLVLVDELGVVHLGENEISRGQYRKLLRDAHRPGAPSATELSLDEARALLAEAVGTSLRAKTPFPEGLERVLRHLEITPWERPFEVPAPEEGDQALAMRGAELHQQPELSQWLPPVDALRKFALHAQEIATSALYLDANQRAQQLRKAVESAVESFLSPPMRQIYGRRLWLMADFFERTGRADPAAIARAEARRISHAAPGVLSPFVVRLFEKVLMLGGPPPQAPEPVEPPAPEEKKSPGGLILP